MAGLKAVIDTIDGIDVALRTFYELRDGKYHLQVEGAPAGFATSADLTAANARVVEFRENNIKLTRELDELRPKLKTFEGIDPVAAKDALDRVAKLEKKGVKSEDDIAAAVTAAVTAAVGPLKLQIGELTTSAATNAKRADDAVMSAFISEKFVKAGGKSSATEYITGKASEMFEVKDGAVVAKANKFSADRPGDALGVDEWLTSMAKAHDFAFGASTGSGAAPVSGGLNGAQTAPRPANQTVIKDPTPQQLGEYSKDVLANKVRFEYSSDAKPV